MNSYAVYFSAEFSTYFYNKVKKNISNHRRYSKNNLDAYLIDLRPNLFSKKKNNTGRTLSQ